MSTIETNEKKLVWIQNRIHKLVFFFLIFGFISIGFDLILRMRSKILSSTLVLVLAEDSLKMEFIVFAYCSPASLETSLSSSRSHLLPSIKTLRTLAFLSNTISMFSTNAWSLLKDFKESIEYITMNPCALLIHLSLNDLNSVDEII